MKEVSIMTDKKESMTAKLCSFARAYHSYYEKDKIFDDYLAYDFMGKEEYERIGSYIYQQFNIPDSEIRPIFESEAIRDIVMEYLTPIPLSRIRYAEKKLIEFAEKNQKCQYVICGAGADTFSFRNTNPNIHIFEIDHPATQKYKLKRIHELQWNIPQNVHFVPVNFEKDDMKKALERAGFDKNKKTFFSIMGVTYYLTLPVFEETVKNIAELSTNGNMILFDYPDDSIQDMQKLKDSESRFGKIVEITGLLGETMKQGFSYSTLKSMLIKYGFTNTEHLTPQDIQKHFFEGRNDKHRAFGNIHFIASAFEKKIISMSKYEKIEIAL